MPTIHDVARQAQVSVSTVSRALSAPQRVRRSTRERVLAAAAELGYEPNRAARGLSTGRTGDIGIVVPDLGNPYYAAVLKGAQSRAKELDLSTLVAGGEDDLAAHRDLVRSLAKQGDGIVLYAADLTDAQLTDLATITPLVVLNRRPRDVSSAYLDTAGGMRQVVDHLAALGHRRCAYLAATAASWPSRERRRGLRAAAARHGVEVLEFGPFPALYEGGVLGADLAVAAGVTAVIAYNDVMALGVLARLRERGVRAPAEVSVTGFDDLIFAGACVPPLTTVALPLGLAGRAAVDLLAARLAEPAAPVQHQELPTHLVVRASTAPPAR